jgi:hypothetical protein
MIDGHPKPDATTLLATGPSQHYIRVYASSTFDPTTRESDISNDTNASSDDGPITTTPMQNYSQTDGHGKENFSN